MIPFFSIIVPIFNCEKYLPECIESVTRQSFDNWELILVDDGSTDKSGQICDDYAIKDKRIIVIHKKNGGEFSSRKAGIDVARGVYITGLDADDYYEIDHLKRIDDAAIKHGADCICYNMSYTGNRSGVDVICEQDMLVDGKTFLLMMIEKANPSFVNKAIKRDIYKSIDYSCVPNVRFSEDALMVYPALCHVKNAYFINIATYYYRIHSKSISACCSFEHIKYNDQVIKYTVEYLKRSESYAPLIERAIVKSYLHMLNERVWRLMLLKKWEVNMADRIKSLSLFDSVIKRYDYSVFSIKERIRIMLIIKERYRTLMLIASIFRLRGVE